MIGTFDQATTRRLVVAVPWAPIALASPSPATIPSPIILGSPSTT